MKTIRLIIPLMMLALTACTGQTYSPIVPLAIPSKFSNDQWSAFLHQVVTPYGYVDWTKIQSNSTAARDQLLTYCGLLEELSPSNHPEFFTTPADQKAYWINAYNAQAILAAANANFPDPIPTPDPFAGPPQAAVFAGQTFSIGQQKMTLADIWTRLQSYHDPRILFAINFCAKSCPPLRPTPYEGKVLEAQLQDQTHEYLSDPRAVRHKGDMARVNQFILANADTFMTAATRPTTTLLAALIPYSAPDSPLRSASAIFWLGFDWSLNRPSVAQ